MAEGEAPVMTRRLSALATGLTMMLVVAAAAQSPHHARGAPPVAPKLVAAASPDGAALFDYHCAACHGAGPGHPGTSALALKYQGQQPALLTERSDLDPDAIKLFVRNGVNAMPFFRKTEIGDADLDRLARYISDAGKAHAVTIKADTKR
jgi:mono/diheme cytochrome c family protein